MAEHTLELIFDDNSDAEYLSDRGEDWLNFATDTLNHIENYTVPQYGDKGDDQYTDFTAQDFITQIKKYLNRYGKNSRPGQGHLDMLKCAHYIQMLSHLDD